MILFIYHPRRDYSPEKYIPVRVNPKPEMKTRHILLDLFLVLSL